MFISFDADSSELAAATLAKFRACGSSASIFFWSLRRRANERPDYPRIPVDLSYPFVALTLLSASAANVRTGLFFGGFVAMAAWALWGVRPRRYPPLVWALVMAVAVAVGWAGHVGIAEAPQPQDRQEQQRRLRQRDREAQAQDERGQQGAAERGHLNTRFARTRSGAP